MKRIREILLTQYIGAITIGFILAQATVQFIDNLAQIGVRYWEIQQSAGRVLDDRPFPWASVIISMASVGLHLLVGFLMIRWLYAEENTQSGSQDEEAPSGEIEP
jgi:hypothetical protein